MPNLCVAGENEEGYLSYRESLPGGVKDPSPISGPPVQSTGMGKKSPQDLAVKNSRNFDCLGRTEG